MKQLSLLLIILNFFSLKYSAQSTFPTNGAPFNTHSIYAFTNATIYVDFETVIKKGTLLIQDGKIISAAEKVEIPNEHPAIYYKGAIDVDAVLEILNGR